LALVTADLLERARRRESAALDLIVQTYSRRLFGLLVRMTDRRDQAEELLQETFLRMVRTIDTYQHSDRFESWLFRIAANLARDVRRRRRRRGPELSLAADDGGSFDDPALLDTRLPGPEDGIVALERREALSRGLQKLTDEQREILALRHEGELSFREIAELLNIPLGTALARAHRALQKLKAEIMGEVDA
jgi:RNA polymerase sigma-70 factor (ECF subfamily)